MKNNKNIIIISLLIVILAMAVGYSAFATQLTINGTAEIVGEWDVKITNIDVQNVSSGCDYGEPQYTNTSATFAAKLKNPGDSVTYVVTVKNAGTINAVLNNVIFTPDDIDGSSAIIYTTTEPDEHLPAGGETTFTVTVKYDEKSTEVPSVKTKTITGIVEYVQE